MWNDKGIRDRFPSEVGQLWWREDLNMKEIIVQSVNRSVENPRYPNSSQAGLIAGATICDTKIIDSKRKNAWEIKRIIKLLSEKSSQWLWLCAR